eukprot:3938357-Rhodomonas_salina.6
MPNWLFTYPSGQGTQSEKESLPVCALNVSGGHSAHSELPIVSLYFPAAHGTHTVSLATTDSVLPLSQMHASSDVAGRELLLERPCGHRTLCPPTQ